MRGASRSRLLFFGSAALVLLLDQLSKAWVVANLPLYTSVDVIPWLSPILSFTYLTNTGVVFGLFPQLGDYFIAIALLVVCLILIFRRTLPQDDWLTHLALGLQVGGAIGNNLIDRLWRGAVVDFIDVNFWPLQDWPVFNLADSAIVAGVCVLLLSTWLEHKRASDDAVA